MTAILGYASGGTVWMGGDSAASSGYDARFTVLERKIFRVGDLLIGGAGMFRPLQVLRASLKVPGQAAGQDDIDYLASDFMVALQKCLDDGKTAMRGTDGGSCSLMIGFHGLLYCVNTDLSISAHRAQAYNLGSGGDLAFGAFWLALNSDSEVISDSKINASMIKGLEVAAAFNSSVDKPFYVEKV